MANKINEILSDGHIKSIKEMSYHIAVVQKLNEELTAENIRLLERIEELEQEVELAENASYWASKEDRR